MRGHLLEGKHSEHEALPYCCAAAGIGEAVSTEHAPEAVEEITAFPGQRIGGHLFNAFGSAAICRSGGGKRRGVWRRCGGRVRQLDCAAML